MTGIFKLLGYILLWLFIVVVTLGVGLVPLALVVLATFAGSEGRAKKALDSLSTTLMPGEQLIAASVQHRVFAFWSRRVTLAITSSRIIVIKRGILGGFTMQDVQWKDLRDAKIERNVWATLCGSNLLFRHSNKSVGPIFVEGINSDSAPLIYTHSQFEEQAWEEKRRIRSMEEVRAASGGVIVHTAAAHPSSVPAPAPVSGNRMLLEIQQAKALLDMGAVSDAEFQEMKSKILASA